MDGMMAARLGAVVFVAVAITAAVVELRRKDEQPEPTPRPAQVNVESPLQSELLRCQRLGEAGPRDPACLRAWAENRRRFLTPGATTVTTDQDLVPATGRPGQQAGGIE